ncbi:MAG: lipocalin family protein [Spirochaetales bacterium]|nr:lipocalin family protein [Spirochaetales bacterium]
MKKLVMVMLLFIYVGFVYGKNNSEPFHEVVDFVDMEKFSGDWYVISLIPTVFEKDASNGIENYSIGDDGVITVKYTFIKNGKNKVMYQKGWIYNTNSNSEWRVRPLWPLKLPYYILELANDYSYTVIGTNNYDYLWIMSRQPKMDKDELNSIIERMVLRGFDREKILFMKQDRG